MGDVTDSPLAADPGPGDGKGDVAGMFIGDVMLGQAWLLGDVTLKDWGLWAAPGGP